MARPILFAYDGSEHAQAAIREAGRQLRNGRPAIVLTVWQPVVTAPLGGPGVPAVGVDGMYETTEEAARRIAHEGAALAREAGFHAEPVAEMGDPIWRRIVDTAEQRDASIVVLGSHGRTGISLALQGSVAEAATRHTDRPVLIAHFAR
jgi:nucleotide-binding universal stress UspA family protein